MLVILGELYGLVESFYGHGDILRFQFIFTHTNIYSTEIVGIFIVL